MTSSEVWDADAAATYDEDVAYLATAAVLAPTIDLLVELAAGGAALEFAIGTGRVAIPLHRRGIAVSGIELSQPMIDVLRNKVRPDEIPVVRGDMSTTLVDGDFSLVYLVSVSYTHLTLPTKRIV